MRKEKDGYAFYAKVVFTIDEQRLTLYKEQVGYIPENLSDSKLKCSSKVLAKRVAKLLHKGHTPNDFKLSRDPQIWADNRSQFEEMCIRVKKLFADENIKHTH